MKKRISIILLALFVVLAGSAAQAALITDNFSGTIDFADAANPFGVASGDTFTWSTTYDLSYKNEWGNITIGDDSNMKLQVTIGSRTFEESEDKFYGPGDFGAPILTFDAQDQVSGVSFLVDDHSNGYRFRNHLDYLGFDIYTMGENDKDDLHLVSGTFSFDPAPVPVPAAAWLLGSGLMGLVGIRRVRA